MSSSRDQLDEKLDKILGSFEWRYGKRKINQYEAVGQIKQAFVDAGYRRVSPPNKPFKPGIRMSADAVPPLLPVDELMTGQAWFERFIYASDYLLEAARQASGVEE